MSWYDEIKQKFGYKKGLDQLTETEMNEIIRGIKVQCDQLEKKTDGVEKEQIRMAQDILKSSKMKAAMLMEQLKQKKAMGNFYVKAYRMATRNAMAMESVLEIRKIMGMMNNQVSKKLETLSPHNIAAFLDVMQHEFSSQSMDSDQIMSTLENFTEGVVAENDEKYFEELGRLQDSILEDVNLSEEEKIRKIMDMA